MKNIFNQLRRLIAEKIIGFAIITLYPKENKNDLTFIVSIANVFEQQLIIEMKDKSK